MFVSLNKNQFLYDWMRDKWHSEILEELVESKVWYRNKEDVNFAKRKLALFLCGKGYVSKVTSRNDILIFIPDQEFVYLRLKYE